MTITLLVQNRIENYSADFYAAGNENEQASGVRITPSAVITPDVFNVNCFPCAPQLKKTFVTPMGKNAL